MSATNRGTIRIASDYYPTPLSAFTPLLPYLPAKTPIWECASGDHRLIDCMRTVHLLASGNDILYGYDFLTDNCLRDVIVTNPPYSLALEFISHALFVSPNVYMLLRLNFLASQKRSVWFRQHEPSALFVLSRRPSFTGIGTDATDYAWFYWGDTHKGIYHL